MLLKSSSKEPASAQARKTEMDEWGDARARKTEGGEAEKTDGGEEVEKTEGGEEAVGCN